MALEKWTCIKCDKSFAVGEWTCADGGHHVVETKEYLLNDAPSDPGHPASGGMDSLRDGRTRICNVPPDKQVVVNGEVRLIPGGYVEFVRGRFSTSDPEIQYILNSKGGWCDEAAWQAAWLSPNQRMSLKEMELNAREQRLENQRNELLAQVKQSKAVATR